MRFIQFYLFASIYAFVSLNKKDKIHQERRDGQKSVRLNFIRQRNLHMNCCIGAEKFMYSLNVSKEIFNIAIVRQSVSTDIL